MSILEQMMERAASNPRRIVLPEGTEPRTLEAADRVLAQKMARIVLIGNREEIMRMAEERGLNHINEAEIIDPLDNPNHKKYADLLFELRKSKGMTIEQAEALAKDPLYLGCLIIKAGDADGELAGARNSTGNVLRPALQIIRTRPGISCVSGAMLMLTQANQYGENGMFVMADVAVMPNPNEKELAQIAVASAQTARALLDIEPRVAMLSFSTKGSASHETVDKVTAATAIARELDPTLKIDGELQADAAIVPAIGEFKAKGSSVAGHANVLVFPTLDAGNIGHKLVQRLGGALAIGPVLQGMNAPVNDLSRGCSVEDIVTMIAVTSNQALANIK